MTKTYKALESKKTEQGNQLDIVEKNIDEAIRLFTLASASGNSEAACLLGGLKKHSKQSEKNKVRVKSVFCVFN